MRTMMMKAPFGFMRSCKVLIFFEAVINVLTNMEGENSIV